MSYDSYCAAAADASVVSLATRCVDAATPLLRHDACRFSPCRCRYMSLMLAAIDSLRMAERLRGLTRHAATSAPL